MFKGEITNESRVERARQALTDYTLQKGEVFECSMDEVTDLIADLLHLTAAIKKRGGFPKAGISAEIDRTLRLARMHFDAEHENPEEMGVSANG